MAGQFQCRILYLLTGIFLTASGQSLKRTYINVYYNIRNINLPRASAICHEFDNDLYLPMLNTTAKILLYKTLKNDLINENSASANRDYRFWTNATSDGTVFFWDDSPTCTALPVSSSLWAPSELAAFMSSNQAATYYEVSSTEYGLYRATNGNSDIQLLVCEKEQEQCEYNGQSSNLCPDSSLPYYTDVRSNVKKEEDCRDLCDAFISGEAECWGFLHSENEDKCTILYHVDPLLLFYDDTNENCPSSYPDDLKYFKKKCYFINFDSGEKSMSGNLRRTCTTAVTYLTTSTTSTTSSTPETSSTTSTESSTSSTTSTTSTASRTLTTTNTTYTSTTSSTSGIISTTSTTSSTTSTTARTSLSTTTSTTSTKTTMFNPPTTRSTTATSPSTTTITPTTSSTIIITTSTMLTNSSTTPTTTSIATPTSSSTTGVTPVAGIRARPHAALFIRSCFCSTVEYANLTLEEWTDQIIETLRIDVSKTSATIRSKTSAKDTRSSSVSIGVVSILFMCVPLFLMFILDVLRLCSTKKQSVNPLSVDRNLDRSEFKEVTADNF